MVAQLLFRCTDKRAHLRVHLGSRQLGLELTKARPAQIGGEAELRRLDSWMELGERHPVLVTEKEAARDVSPPFDHRQRADGVAGADGVFGSALLQIGRCQTPAVVRDLHLWVLLKVKG